MIAERAKFDPSDAENLRRWHDEHPSSENPDKIAWRYNRIIGWIEFYADGMRLKADLWLARGNRIGRNFRRVTIDYRSKLGDVSTHFVPTNEHLESSIIEFLEAVSRGESWKRLGNYFISIDEITEELRTINILKRLLNVNDAKR